MPKGHPYAPYAFAIANASADTPETAILAADKSVRLNPGFALGQLVRGLALVFDGQAAPAVEALTRGLELNPNDPQNFTWHSFLALAHLFAGDAEADVASAREGFKVRSDWRPMLQVLTAALAATGRIEDARRAAARLRAVEMPAGGPGALMRRLPPDWDARLTRLMGSTAATDPRADATSDDADVGTLNVRPAAPGTDCTTQPQPETRMRPIAALLAASLGLAALPAFAGEQYVDMTGYAASGHDVVAYFDLEQAPVGATQPAAVPGRSDIAVEWNGANFAFATIENRDRFLADPAAFAPRYDGHCAFGVAKGGKVPGNPDLWRIVDGKLYLNITQNVVEFWEADIPGNLQLSEANWAGLEPLAASSDPVPRYEPDAPRAR